MTKSETVRQLAAASNAAWMEALNQQIESLRQAKLTSVEELATLLEPLAQAMAVDGRDENEPGANRGAQRGGAGRTIPGTGRDSDHVLAKPTIAAEQAA